jgi:uncharacterized NAD(P)/FAD-binding protein YdhS
MKRITIVGGGASGTLLAVNLLRNPSKNELEINLVERRSRVGRGVAFGTDQATHLLNVPAGRMGAFPDDIGHFHKWLVDSGHSYTDHDFVPRRLFGQYLRELFDAHTADLRPGVRFNLIDDEAVDLSVNGDSAEVMLRSGEVLPSNKVVLAFGNFAPPNPYVADLSFTRSGRYFQDPWSREMYDALDKDDSIFIIGTGLSMVDVAIHLNQTGHRGKITAISTRGLLPAVHELGHTYPAFSDELRPMTRITDMMKAVRRHIAAAESNGGNWRGVIDSLRAATPQLWQQLPLAEKRLFMQHLSRYWNVARHRMPREAADILDAMKADGKLEILKGRLKTIEERDGVFSITFENLAGRHTATSGVLVNCIGSQTNFSKIDSTFVQNLIRRRHIRNDDLAQGIAASPDGRVLDRDEQFSNVVYTLGTALRGTLWETTAIPEIRTQAKALAQQLLD